jgi:hypothetical protein
MAIPPKDWIKDTEWREVHLTPAGWVSGTIRTEKGRYENERDPPPDCLISVRMLQKMPADPGQAPADWSEIRWCTNDLKALERAQEKFGVLPWHAPALSPSSAASHSAIPGLASMRLSESRRPRPSGRPERP